ncbi:hypothetical protein FZZ93_08840 [Halomonas eurihalina]|uniref:Uncharacterized protein n=1 Tax=Halomonas eurihalina TaxID=42566 RepID=A0A5D9D6T6_HALER|nr:hypothetical protein [Halomonas eurihalina]TZG39868.1 hypothetical protein FZZ93_08840 [Halomonas eurihalina]
MRLDQLPNIDPEYLHPIDIDALVGPDQPRHPPHLLVLHPQPKAFNEFDEAGRMHLSPLYYRVVDVCEELVKFTWMTRGRAAYLTDRYSERVESAEAVSRRVNQATH